MVTIFEFGLVENFQPCVYFKKSKNLPLKAGDFFVSKSFTHLFLRSYFEKKCPNSS